MIDETETQYPYEFDEDANDPGELCFKQHKQVLIMLDHLPACYLLPIKRAHDLLSQSKLAEKLGMATSTLCEYEQGKRPISRKYFPAINSYLYREFYWGGAQTDIFDFEFFEGDELNVN